MHGVYLSVEVLSNDLFLLLSGGLGEGGQQLLGGVVVRGNLLLGRGHLGLRWGTWWVSHTWSELHSSLEREGGREGEREGGREGERGGGREGGG